MKLQDTLSSYLRLSISQFKGVYILWTVLSTIYVAIIWFSIYIVFTDLELYHDKLASAFRFTWFPALMGSMVLLALLIPINVILFYVAHFFAAKSIDAILTWLPIVKLILFAYWLMVIIDGDGADTILGPMFIISDCMVWIKHRAYFRFLAEKHNKDSPIDPLFGNR